MDIKNQNYLRKIKVYTFFILFIFSLFIVNGVSEVTARQSSEAGNENGGGGNTTNYSHFANYGTRVQTIYCQKTTMGTNGIQITYYFANVYWLLEYCVNGGTTKECTVGTSRQTYQGGGC